MSNLVFGVLLLVFSGKVFLKKDFRSFFIPPAVIFILTGLAHLIGHEVLWFRILVLPFMLAYLIFVTYELKKKRRFFTLQGRLISKNNPLYQALEAYIVSFLKEQDLSPQDIRLYPLGLIGIDFRVLKSLDEAAFDKGLISLVPKTKYLYNKLLGVLSFLVGLGLVLSNLSKLI